MRVQSQIDFKLRLRHMTLKTQTHPPTCLSVTDQKMPETDETVLSIEIRKFGFYLALYE